MVVRYRHQDLTDKKRFGHSGHATFRAKYHGTPVIYKANKNGRVKASVYEVAFSEIARLHMMPHITPDYALCEDENENIVGVCSESIQCALQRRHPGEALYSLAYSPHSHEYEVSLPDTTGSWMKQHHETPCHFLNEMPKGFFAALMDADGNGKYQIDMETLASTLVGKYVLEEDDLHKGNLGIYTRKIHGVNVVNFFNIDHDLLMSGSITSFFDQRGPNFAYGVTDYQITARDLLNFPDLKDSKNHYWPTQHRFMVMPGDKKIYDHTPEREAFARLKDNPEFKRYKWKYLLKSAIIPPELTDYALTQHLDCNNADQNQDRILIAQALAERQSQLRAVLFSLGEFREYLSSPHAAEDIADIKRQLGAYGGENTPDLERILRQTHTDLNAVRHQIIDSDTPLHVAIRLQDYRFEQSIILYGSDINRENSYGYRPIDLAARSMADFTNKGALETKDPSKDPVFVMQHLLKNGARLTETARKALEACGFAIHRGKIGRYEEQPVRKTFLRSGPRFVPHHFPSQYYNMVNSYESLMQAITAIGQDPRLTLKTKKELTVTLVRRNKNCMTENEWEQFKTALNGNGPEHPVENHLKFLHQLRSQLWIIRWLRGGLYGETTSVRKLNRMLTHGPSTTHTQEPWPELSSNALRDSDVSSSDSVDALSLGTHHDDDTNNSTQLSIL